jgi:hypothetical protein
MSVCAKKAVTGQSSSIQPDWCLMAAYLISYGLEFACDVMFIEHESFKG